MDQVLSELTRVAPLLLLGLAIYLLVLVLMTLWMLTHPPRRTYSWALARGLAGDPSELDTPREYSEETFTLGCATVVAWRIPGDNPGGPVAVLSPGWGDGRLGALRRVEPYLSRCSEVIAWDPPGLGSSPGRCTLGAREPALLARLVEQTRGGRAVVLAGWSLGAGVSLAGSSLIEPAPIGVIAEAPYRLVRTPAANVLGLNRYPYRLNLPPALALLGALSGAGPRWRRFDRAAHAARLPCPLLVLHGDADPVSPIEDGREIAERAREAGRDVELVETPGGEHNDLWTHDEHRPTQLSTVGAFLDRVSARIPPAS